MPRAPPDLDGAPGPARVTPPGYRDPRSSLLLGAGELPAGARLPCVAWSGAHRWFPLVLLAHSTAAAVLVWPFGGWPQLSGCSGGAGAAVEAVPWGNTAIGWAPVLLRLALLGAAFGVSWWRNRHAESHGPGNRGAACWEDLVLRGRGAQLRWAEARQARGLGANKAVAVSVAQFFCWHCIQPLAYLWLFGLYFCELSSFSSGELSLWASERNLARVVAAREVLYLGMAGAGVWICPAYLLLDLHATWCYKAATASRLEPLRYVATCVLTPHHFVALVLAKRVRQSAQLGLVSEDDGGINGPSPRLLPRNIFEACVMPWGGSMEEAAMEDKPRPREFGVLDCILQGVVFATALADLCSCLALVALLQRFAVGDPLPPGLVIGYVLTTSATLSLHGPALVVACFRRAHKHWRRLMFNGESAPTSVLKAGPLGMIGACSAFGLLYLAVGILLLIGGVDLRCSFLVSGPDCGENGVCKGGACACDIGFGGLLCAAVGYPPCAAVNSPCCGKDLDQCLSGMRQMCVVAGLKPSPCVCTGAVLDGVKEQLGEQCAPAFALSGRFLAGETRAENWLGAYARTDQRCAGAPVYLRPKADGMWPGFLYRRARATVRSKDAAVASASFHWAIGPGDTAAQCEVNSLVLDADGGDAQQTSEQEQCDGDANVDAPTTCIVAGQWRECNVELGFCREYGELETVWWDNPSLNVWPVNANT